MIRALIIALLLTSAAYGQTVAQNGDCPSGTAAVKNMDGTFNCTTYAGLIAISLWKSVV